MFLPMLFASQDTRSEQERERERVKYVQTGHKGKGKGYLNATLLQLHYK